MMTSRNGNIFRVTGPLWRESIGDRWFPSQGPVTPSFGVFFAVLLMDRYASGLKELTVCVSLTLNAVGFSRTSLGLNHVKRKFLTIRSLEISKPRDLSLPIVRNIHRPLGSNIAQPPVKFQCSGNMRRTSRFRDFARTSRDLTCQFGE